MCNDQLVLPAVPVGSTITVLVTPNVGNYVADAAVGSNQGATQSWSDAELRAGRSRRIAAGERLVIDVRAVNPTNTATDTTITVTVTGPNGLPVVAPAVSICHLEPARRHLMTVDVEAPAAAAAGPRFEAVGPAGDAAPVGGRAVGATPRPKEPAAAERKSARADAQPRAAKAAKGPKSGKPKAAKKSTKPAKGSTKKPKRGR